MVYIAHVLFDILHQKEYRTSSYTSFSRMAFLTNSARELTSSF